MPPSFDARGTSKAIFDELADESLGKDDTYVCEASHNYPLKKFLALVFKFVIGILRN